MNGIPKIASSGLALLVVVLSGCASYRTDSNITVESTPAVNPNANVQIIEGLPDRKYTEVGPIEVSVKKLTAFHSDPTKEHANAALIERARIIGADAVIRVTYESGIGFTTWGYIDAKGVGVKWTGSAQSGTGSEARLRELKRLFDSGLITKDAYVEQQKKVLDSQK